MRASLAERLWRLVAKDSETGCWNWTGSRSKNGYGRIYITAQEKQLRQAHRVMYELVVGPVPAELDIDHLCRNRACVNPAHLEPVTRQVNVRRGAGNGNAEKTRCKKGHPLSGENLGRNPNGGRVCRTCMRERSAAWYETNRDRINEAKRKRRAAAKAGV